MNKIKFVNIFYSFILLFFLVGCRDDDMPSLEIGEGETQIAVEVKFEPLTSALENTRTPGNAIKEIESLSVVVYDSNHKFVKLYNLSDLVDYSYSIDGNKDMPTSGVDKKPIGSQAEKTTARATFKVPNLPFGKYRIYAVANMGDLTEEEVEDIETLKNKSLDWNADNIAVNNKMFGYFTASTDKNGGAEGFDAPPIIINKDMKSIHAWIKRMVSKVTVAFDPAGLKQGVWIYIHDVSIRDIPATCLLGADNTPDKDSELLNKYNEKLSELPISSKLIYNKDGLLSAEAAAADQNQDFKNDVDKNIYTSWLTLAKGSGVKGSDHSETAEALYFFENMQGNFESTKEHNKEVLPSEIKGDCITSPSQEGYKNGVVFGTYIEVTGYYVSQNPENTTQGKIKYRFMLGKNDTYDFNAQRNHHYKLTLGFDGWANQPKWNIEYYEQDPGIYLPDQFDVSYLYNQKHMMPIKIVGNCTGLKVEIVENNWAPYDPSSSDGVPTQNVGSGTYAFKWNRPAWENATHTYKYKQKNIKETDSEEQLTNDTQFGFLALAVPVNIGMPPKSIVDINYNSDNGGRESAQTALDQYYESNGGEKSWNTGSQRVREFTAEQLDPQGGETKNGAYFKGHNGWQVHKIDDDSKMLHIPLFTRNKSMILGSGFSGNNPYESYKRKAVIRVTATFEGGQTIVKQVPVLQTERVVNPKGVWRKWNDNEDFEVKLMKVIKEGENMEPGEKYFETFRSTGEWKAYIEMKSPGANFLSLEKGVVADTIYGDTDTPIEFTLKFAGVSENTSQCAVVRVDYNGNNCVHKIMVRQGYMAPIKLGDARWSSFSLYSCDDSNAKTSGEVSDLDVVLTTNPLALGTLFKRHNTKQGIRIINNNDIGPFIAPNNRNFTLTSGENLNWNGIVPIANNASVANNIPALNVNNFTLSWGTFQSKTFNRKYRLPTYEEFQSLDSKEFGFGVLYTDESYTTATTWDGAYGYQAPNNLENGPDTGKGARGVIVYDRDNANQIFFPVGRNGMGRRTRYNVQDATYRGVLRYADVYDVLAGSTNDNYYRPVPYNLPIVPGAIYWINTIKQNGNDNQYSVAGWDMNYFNFDFNSYPDNSWQRLSDARPIKFVVIE